MRRMWIFAALAALLLSGCGAKTQASEPWEELGVSEAAWTVIEDFSGRYSALDADGLRYDEALEAVRSYLDGGLGQAEALGALNSALEAVEAELEAAEPVSLDAGLEEALRELCISPTEYEAFANSRPNDLQNQQLRLSSLLFYLENAGRGEAALEDLRFTLAANASEQESLRGYFYYGCLNYWFTGLDEAELELLRSSLIDGLESYIPEQALWFTDRDMAEEQTMLCLDEVEALADLMSERLGSQQDELYEMEHDYDRLLELIEEDRQARERLAALMELSARLEELSAQIDEASEAGDAERLEELRAQFEALVAEYEALTAEETP